MRIPQRTFSPIIATLFNLLLAYVIFMLCRVAYVWENWSLFAPGWQDLDMSDLLRGSLRFDSSAIFYTNAIYLILMLLPLRITQRDWWQVLTKWVFMVVNSLVVVINLSDSVYSQFSGRRTTATFFNEFSNEGNLGSIFFTELWRHWYLLLAGIAIIALMWVVYLQPSGKAKQKNKKKKAKTSRSHFIIRLFAFLLLFPVAVIAMRGGVGRQVRPITISNANQYVNQPHEAAIVLNTPFSIIRTIGKTTFADPGYFDKECLSEIYSPLHFPKAIDTLSHPQKQKNVVVLIVESFACEYIGFYNKDLDNGTYRGYTPFVDSLLSQSLTWQQCFANGRKSIDAMPSILSSIPMFVEPFFVTNYSLNNVSGLAGELGKVGYSSAFFHGADNGSMGFQAFARSTGFQHYYGRDDYDKDSRFNGEKDYDGTWAIWDEPFLQYYALKMNDLQEPFVTAVFTASSHHPFVIPEEYKKTFPEEEMVMHKCIRYTDNALRKFFATASKQPWFKNTIFVLTCDHTNMTNHDYYRTSIGVFRAPLLIYDPSGDLPTGVLPGVAQQIDIMPTLLRLLDYPNPFIAFGKDLLSTHPDSSWTVNYNNGIYQYLCRDTLIQFDGEKVIATFDIHNDPLLKKPIPIPPSQHTKHLKAIIQQYMTRMLNNQLIVESSE